VLKVMIFIISIFSVSAGYCAESKTERTQKQAELDGICEEARQRALLPTKKKIYQECLNKKIKGESECAQDADSYNGNRGAAAPLYYDLPECEAAFKFRKAYRNTD